MAKGQESTNCLFLCLMHLRFRLRQSHISVSKLGDLLQLRLCLQSLHAGGFLCSPLLSFCSETLLFPDLTYLYLFI